MAKRIIWRHCLGICGTGQRTACEGLEGKPLIKQGRLTDLTGDNTANIAHAQRETDRSSTLAIGSCILRIISIDTTSATDIACVTLTVLNQLKFPPPSAQAQLAIKKHAKYLTPTLTLPSPLANNTTYPTTPNGTVTTHASHLFPHRSLPHATTPYTALPQKNTGMLKY